MISTEVHNPWYKIDDNPNPNEKLTLMKLDCMEKQPINEALENNCRCCKNDFKLTSLVQLFELMLIKTPQIAQ